ncbi:hypothetical protein BGW80DRAFT_1343700 [Lactifluus volemus]|nr:hypothetical protein BGW80DRAFT_1343700 [Lactifluus volemus]
MLKPVSPLLLHLAQYRKVLPIQVQSYHPLPTQCRILIPHRLCLYPSFTHPFPRRLATFHFRKTTQISELSLTFQCHHPRAQLLTILFL